MLIAIVMLTGCNLETKPEQPAPAAASGQPSRAAVPLRVWFVGDEANRAIIQRQWQAASERPVDVRMLSSEELLAAEHCACDVLVYPAHVMGEVIDRKWLVELPGNLAPGSLSAGGSISEAGALAKSTARDAPAPSEATANSTKGAAAELDASRLQPAAWIEQTRYGRSLWGLSLGATTPVIMTNFQFGEAAESADQEPQATDAKAFWQTAIEALTERADGKVNEHPSLVDADRLAVCDRFLLLATSLSQRESRFGALLDPETLKPRLAEKDFIDAAEIMLELHRLNAVPQAMAGSYLAAWKALSSDEPALSIGLPPPPTPEVDKVTSIALRMPPRPTESSSVRGAAGDATMGWNSGHGRVASLTTQCRQTSLAIEFLRWLSSEPNRNVLSRSVDGISAASVYAPGSSAWQAQRLSLRIAQQPRLPNQPRLPGSAQYRLTLGEQLVRMLAGELEPAAAMNAAAAAWDDITAKRDQAQLRSSYEASLGL